MSYLWAFGSQGAEIVPHLWGLLILSTLVVVIIAVLVVVGTLRRRRRGEIVLGRREELVRTGSGLPWISIGVGLTTIALLGSMAWTVATLAGINRPQGDPKLTVEVIGHQWWWEVRYHDDNASRTLVTANEIHMPVGEPVRFRLTSTDVIHSFWVPALGGKTDLIPGQMNATWLQADEPGIYRGQCAEYCGKQHAHMALQVVANGREDFEAWMARQLEPAPAPATAEIEEGQRLFVTRCGACHTVRGTLAGGRLGPDLTHLMSRLTIAAGTLPNTIGHLSGWIANPQGIKPGNRMPNLDISAIELAKIRAFLETLE